MTDMKRPLVGTIHPDDMTDIREGVEIAQRAVDYLHAQGIRIDIPHTWRWWEYGTAIQIMLNHYQERLEQITLLDVGSGVGALGPVMASMFNIAVTEYEPEAVYCADRVPLQQLLTQKQKKGLTVQQVGLEAMPRKKFDVVCCISVLEHVSPELERKLWLDLAARVKKNGMLFITTDCVPEKGKSYTYDNLRQQNFTVEDLRDRVEGLVTNMQMTPLGKPDYRYNGSFVHDYSFFRAGLAAA